MIEHEIEDWILFLPALAVELDGMERGVCLQCLSPALRAAANILETDLHGAVHPLIMSLEHFTRDYDEDATEQLDYEGPSGSELVALELLFRSETIRHALDVYVAPRVDAYVVESTQYLDVRDK